MLQVRAEKTVGLPGEQRRRLDLRLSNLGDSSS